MGMYGGGGDGGAGEMRRQEDARQARIQSGVDAINSIFDKQVFGVKGPDGNFYSFAKPGEERKPFSGVWDAVRNGTYGGAAAPLTVYGKEGNAHVLGGASRNPGIAGGLNLPEGYSQWTHNVRDELYNEQKQAVTDVNKLDVDKQYQQAERAGRFGLARSGLMGGSEDINLNEDLRERQNKGLIQAAALGDSAAAELKIQDERARQALIGHAQAGTDVGTLQSSAMKQLDAAAQAASGDAKVASIGDLFGDLSQSYLLNQRRQGMIDGRNQQGSQNYGAGNVRADYSGTVNR